MRRNILKEAPSTWDGEAAEAHGQHQEGDGHPAGVGEAHHQQQGGLHPEAWGGGGGGRQTPSNINRSLQNNQLSFGRQI